MLIEPVTLTLPPLADHFKVKIPVLPTCAGRIDVIGWEYFQIEIQHFDWMIWIRWSFGDSLDEVSVGWLLGSKA